MYSRKGNLLPVYGTLIWRNQKTDKNDHYLQLNSLGFRSDEVIAISFWLKICRNTNSKSITALPTLAIPNKE
jgi:hypothetical protein